MKVHAIAQTNQRPQSEIYREAALRWNDLDSAARLLEDTKSAVLAQKISQLQGEFPHYSHAKAEQKVKASSTWIDYLEKIVRARTAANRAQIEVQFQRMKHWEATQDRADERFTARLG
jgi:hypothetical protein